MKRNNNFKIRTVGDEHMLVPVGSAVVSSKGIVMLNDVGCYLWELLTEDRTSDELAIALTTHFDVHIDRARTDTQAFLDEMKMFGLLGT